jgi:CTP:molybdopterin cytidylyltransferase MocA
MSKIKLEFKIEEVDVILTALGDQPFVKVAELISKIRSQALPQYEAMKAEETGTPTPPQE